MDSWAAARKLEVRGGSTLCWARAPPYCRGEGVRLCSGDPEPSEQEEEAKDLCIFIF